ncbi:MAG: hypothetical protein J6Q15_01970 [Clostridia bacterium]|nr:hypothetical protein [Clostridia bacterium]
MRKYAIPKIAYILLILMLTCVTIGNTYAYFSSHATANSNVTLGKISIEWQDYTSEALIPSLFDDPTAIAISGDLTRGEYTSIQARTKTDAEDETTEVSLAMSNVDGTINAYCRIGIVAKYTPKNLTTEITCENGWIQLALKNAKSGVTKLITDNGWFYYNGYYYYGSETKDGEGNVTARTLTELECGTSQEVANNLFLSDSAASNMFGASVSITLTLEGIQTTNDAYQYAWQLPENWIFS